MTVLTMLSVFIVATVATLVAALIVSALVEAFVDTCHFIEYVGFSVPVVRWIVMPIVILVTHFTPGRRSW
ncbi:MAG: hypothetical protein Q7T01_02895 [bacterium]|nr:hypothetical protein [bacterium]